MKLRLPHRDSISPYHTTAIKAIAIHQPFIFQIQASSSPCPCNATICERKGELQHIHPNQGFAKHRVVDQWRSFSALRLSRGSVMRMIMSLPKRGSMALDHSKVIGSATPTPALLTHSSQTNEKDSSLQVNQPQEARPAQRGWYLDQNRRRIPIVSDGETLISGCN
jgi:hypothetical protein